MESVQGSMTDAATKTASAAQDASASLTQTVKKAFAKD